MLHYFPGMTPEFVVYGPKGAPDGTGMPWDWWEAGKAYIEAMRRPAD